MFIKERLRYRLRVWRIAVSHAVVEPTDVIRRVEQFINRHERFDERPTPVVVTRIAREQKESSWSYQGYDLMMFHVEIGLLDVCAEIPNRVPIAESQPDAAFAEHSDLVALIKRGGIKRFLRAQRVADAADAVFVHVR